MNLEVGDTARIKTPWVPKAVGFFPGSRQQARMRLYAALFAMDFATIIAAFVVANVLRSASPFARSGINILVVLLPLYVAIALNRHVYGIEIFQRWKSAAWRSLTSLGAAVLAVLFVSFYLQASAAMSREVFTVGTTLAAGLMLTSRYLLHRYAARVFGGEPICNLLIRDGVDLRTGPHVTVINAAALDLRPDITDPHALDRIGRMLTRADRVVIACPEERRAAWSAMLKGANIRGEIVAPELEEVATLGAAKFENRSTLIVSVGPLDMQSRALKRGLDLLLSGAALIVLAPLMLAVAIAIRIDSKGPVLFVQQRLGRGNRLFSMYKFRSMREDQCDSIGSRSTTRDDDRVTRIGRFIRATSIDELPQLLNVLTGDMSVVGPRPHALGSLAGEKLFWEVDPRYWHRHATKPGITGLAQVRGFRGATHMQSDLVDRLHADLDYLNGWTLWRDISILLMTFRVVLHRNAY